MVDPRHPASKKLMWNITNTFSTITVLVQQVVWNLKVKQHQNSVGSTHSSFTMSSSVPARGMWIFLHLYNKIKNPSPHLKIHLLRTASMQQQVSINSKINQLAWILQQSNSLPHRSDHYHYKHLSMCPSPTLKWNGLCFEHYRNATIL